MLSKYLEAIGQPGSTKKLTEFILNELVKKGYNRTSQHDAKINLKTSEVNEIKKIIDSVDPKLFVNFQSPIFKKNLGGLSNKYPTHVFSLLKDFEVNGIIFPKDTIFKIANAFLSNTEGSAVMQLGHKSLTPSELHLEDVKWNSVIKLSNAVRKNFPASYESNILDLLNILIKEVSTKVTRKPRTADGLIDISDNEATTFILPDYALELIETIHQSDLNTVGKNFGEVLGGFYFLKKYLAENVYYPSQSNYPLIDFIADDVVFVSSKFGGGAAPSSKVLANKMSENKRRFAKIDGRLKAILNNMLTSSTMYSFIAASKIMNTQIYRKLKKYKIVDDVNTGKENNTAALINNFINSKYEKFGKNDDKMIEFLRKEFWGYGSGEPALANAKEKLKVGKKTEGLIMYPLESELVNVLNSDLAIMNGLKSITKTIGVKQLYLDFKINKKKNEMVFYVKFFETRDFKFILTNSVNNYLNSNLSFKMV